MTRKRHAGAREQRAGEGELGALAEIQVRAPRAHVERIRRVLEPGPVPDLEPNEVPAHHGTRPTARHGPQTRERHRTELRGHTRHPRGPPGDIEGGVGHAAVRLRRDLAARALKRRRKVRESSPHAPDQRDGVRRGLLSALARPDREERVHEHRAAHQSNPALRRGAGPVGTRRPGTRIEPPRPERSRTASRIVADKPEVEVRRARGAQERGGGNSTGIDTARRRSFACMSIDPIDESVQRRSTSAEPVELRVNAGPQLRASIGSGIDTARRGRGASPGRGRLRKLSLNPVEVERQLVVRIARP